jgi:hypothetical protein
MPHNTILIDVHDLKEVQQWMRHFNVEAVTTDLVFTISLKAAPKIFSYPQAGPADYSIFQEYPYAGSGNYRRGGLL